MIDTEKKLTVLFCSLSCFIVFLFYQHTLSYSWKFFDEDIIYNETILPIPNSLSEAFEMMKTFGIKNHFEASNPIYTNISNIRGTPIDVIFCLTVFSLFKKSPYAYHLFALVFHIVNSCFCFLILNKVFTSIIEIGFSNKFRLITVSSLTLLWALHPVNVESVLFTANFAAPFTYSFYLFFIYYFIRKINSKKDRAISKINLVFLFFLYLFPLLLNEYSVTLPLVLFSYIFATLLFKDTSLNSAFQNSFKLIAPILCGLIIFAIYFLSFPSVRTTQENSLIIPLERILWLSPQLFIHYLKLILFPLHLSIDQMAFVKLSNSLFEPYALLCALFMFGLIFLSFISLFFIRKKMLYYFFVLFVPCFLSLFPFLHIASPAYNLVSERYLYIPLFFVIFGLSHIFSEIFKLFKDKKQKIPATLVIVLLIIILQPIARAYSRTFDWKDSTTLLTSAIQTAPNPLYKGLRQAMLASSIKSGNGLNSANTVNLEYIKAIELLKESLIEFEDKKREFQNKTPAIINFYGLDSQTLQAKTAFLIAYCIFYTTGDFSHVLETFKPYANNIKYYETSILDFYYKILFNTKNIDAAEKLLTKSFQQGKVSPLLYVALSDLYEYKYNDLHLAKEYLDKSINLFPYDPLTIFALKRFHEKQNNAEKFAFYSYLYGLRAHSALDLQEAVAVYIDLKQKNASKNILLKLIRDYPKDENTLIIKRRFELVFGKLDV